jgi:hypothetical protein
MATGQAALEALNGRACSRFVFIVERVLPQHIGEENRVIRIGLHDLIEGANQIESMKIESRLATR